MGRVIHTGQALVDVVVTVDALPRRGQNAMANSYDRYAGGSVNVLVAAARTGAATVLAGAVGTGPNGDLIRATCAREGVVVSAPPVAGMDTGICFVMVEPSAERTFVTTQRAERQLSVDILAASDPQPGDVVCVTGYSLANPHTALPLLAWLPSLADGVLVLLDPGAAFAGLPDDVRLPALALIDVWSSNAEEAEQLTGVARPMAEAVRGVAEHLRAGTVVIVRDGPRGCAVLDRGTTTTVPGFPQKPVDTNGAGDAHTGVLVGEFERGLGWSDAATRANAAAALKVTRRGPATAPTRAEVDEFLARLSPH